LILVKIQNSIEPHSHGPDSDIRNGQAVLGRVWSTVETDTDSLMQRGGDLGKYIFWNSADSFSLPQQHAYRPNRCVGTVVV